MAWCRQATSHYLKQCWLRSMSPYGVTGPQWANFNNMSVGKISMPYNILLQYTDFPKMSSCWLQMSWDQIDARPSATTVHASFYFPPTIVIMMVADVLAPNWCQAICSHHVDITLTIMTHESYYTTYILHYSQIMMTSSNGNIFCITGPLCGEFTGHRWIPLTKASDVELRCFLWSAPE